MRKAHTVWVWCLMTALAMPTAMAAEPASTVYEGTWLTINRQLDGRMTSVVTELGNNKYRGRFYGVWQGVSFDYKVDFSGPPDKLVGSANIDGADYVWTGTLTKGKNGAFNGSFDGSRYRGSFELKQKVAAK